jgi:flagellar FliJ protein
MARFRFRLQTLERLREATRDELRSRLAEAFHAEQVIADQRAVLLQETVELAASRRRLMAEELVDVTRLLESQRYQLLLEAQSRALAKQAAQLAEETEARRRAVVEADRQVRVLAKLRERRKRQHDAAEQAAEAKRLDEIAAMRWEARR